MRDLKYLAAIKTVPGEYNDIEIVTDADWAAARYAALASGADSTAVEAAYANRYAQRSDLLNLSMVGDIQTVANADRVRQDVAKILLTEMGLMPYPNYGSSLPLMPANAPYTSTLLDQVSSEVVSAVQYLVYTEESTLSAEQIAEIKSLDVNFERSTVNIKLILSTKAADEVTLGFSL